MTRAFVLDVLERLIKTFLQAFTAALVATWSASSLQVTDVTNWSTLAKLVGPALVAGGAAVLSVLTSLASGLKTNTASASMIVATTAATPGGHAAVPVITSLAAPAAIVPEPLPDSPAVLVADPLVPATTEGVTP